MRKKEIVEKRKLLLRCDKFVDQVQITFKHNPEYATMFMENTLDSLAYSNIESDDFEDISDMERADQLKKKIHDAHSSFQQNISQEQKNTVFLMKNFLDSEREEMLDHEHYCKADENWNSPTYGPLGSTELDGLSNREKFEFIDPLHRGRVRKYYTLIWVIIGGAFLFLISTLGVMGDCLENSEGECLEDENGVRIYENEGTLIYNLGLLVGGLVLVVVFLGLIGLIPGWFWMRKYRREWLLLQEQSTIINSNEYEFNRLRDKFGTFVSLEIASIRLAKEEWLSLLTPDSPELFLSIPTLPTGLGVTETTPSDSIFAS